MKTVTQGENWGKFWNTMETVKNCEKRWEKIKNVKTLKNGEQLLTTVIKNEKNWNCENGEKQNRTTHNKTWQQTTDGKRNLETESAL